MKQCSKQQGLRVCVSPRPSHSSDDGGFFLEVWDLRGRPIGEALVERRVLNRAPGMGGRPALRMASVDIDASVRRGGAGTALYEKALELACAEKAILVSDFHRSEYAEAFWRKQRRLGRVTCVKRNTRGKYAANYFVGPMETVVDAIQTDCYEMHRTEKAQKKCVVERTKAVKKGLPKASRVNDPSSQNHRGRYWPCGLFAVKKSHCGGSLRGINGVGHRGKKGK